MKSDGGYGYDSTDAAAIRYRIQTLKSDWLIYVTDMGQCDHFRGIFSLAHRAGWLGPNGKRKIKMRMKRRNSFLTQNSTTNLLFFFFIYFFPFSSCFLCNSKIKTIILLGTPSSNVMNFIKDPKKESVVDIATKNYNLDAMKESQSVMTAANGIRVDHVGFGVVQGKDKKRFKTRSGETVRLVDLLDEAKRRVGHELSTRLINGQTYVTANEVDSSSSAIGYGAVKYCDLRATRTKDYVFDYDDMLSMNGDTAVYLLYAHARFCSIVRKSGKDPRALLLCNPGLIVACNEPQEKALILQLSKLTDVLELLMETLMPHHLCAYLYDLAQCITAFTRDCRVLGSDVEDRRVLLCEASAVTMRTCLNLLGIEAPMRL